MPARSAVMPLVLLALAGLTVVAYWPGLHGGFLFDDFANLPALGSSGPITNWPTFWRYITSGVADPTGRPLTMLTFLVDAQDWPASPFPFKRTNLILHLVNGALLFCLLQRLGRLGPLLANASPDRSAAKDAAPGFWRADLAAALGAALWTLHPLWISTTFYIVQREAMLPATFTLLGLLAWLRGREKILSGEVLRGFGWIGLGLGLATLCGLLSKANGILLPGLALVIEYVWLRRFPADLAGVGRATDGRRDVYRRVMWIFGWVPTIGVVAYLAWSGWTGFTVQPSARSWTLEERLITEPRIIVDYLSLLWVPRPFTPGLFNDHVVVARSLLSPWTTLPSILSVLGLIGGAWALRKRFPAWALVVLFYFYGQSLESTTIPLELYFEHRNYLPAMLFFWPLALWLCGVVPATCKQLASAADDDSIRHTGIKKRPLIASLSYGPAASPSTVRQVDSAKFILALVLICGLSGMTFVRAQLWGDTHEQALLWAKLNPDSARAQTNAAQLEMTAGQPEQAIKRLDAALIEAPDQLQLALNLIGAHCMNQTLTPQVLAQAQHVMSISRDPGALLSHWFESSIDLAVDGQCQGLTLDSLEHLLRAGLANPELADEPGRHQDLLHFKGRIALARKDSIGALADFNAALDQDPRPGIALTQAALLGGAGYPAAGLSHLDHYASLKHDGAAGTAIAFGMPRVHEWVLQQQHYWPHETTRLRGTLRKDAEQAPFDHQ